MGSEISTSFYQKSDSWLLQVLPYCTWKDRFEVFLVARTFHRFQQSDYFWKWMCGRLDAENSVYSPLVIPVSLTFRKLFWELYPLKKMWNTVVSNDDGPLQIMHGGDKGKISVYARFSPKRPKVAALGSIEVNNENEEVENADDDVEVTLPLHQRLAMIRMSHNLKSNRQALKVLTTEGGWFQSKWDNIANQQNGEKSLSGESFQTDENFDINDENQTRATAMPTFAPKRSRTIRDKITAAVQIVDPAAGKVVMIAPDVGLREFSFDGVFPCKATQKGVYDTVAKRLVCDFINGYNATVIVYGQTGSGKTFSMFGQDEYDMFSGGEGMRGVVPRACEEILTAMHKRRESSQAIESSIGVSYVEVFGDQVSDLLKSGARCGHSKVAAQRYVLLGAAEQPINSMEDVADILKRGALQKKRAATAMNDRSSRAHSLFILTLHQRCVNTGTERTSRLFLADLGGSEQVKKSKVEAGVHRLVGPDDHSMGFEMGDRMREAVYINLGLLALKKCIEALNGRALYTPYQDSKLTMLLSSGLGGNCKTSVIVCGSMDGYNASETVASLRFGERCALIEIEAGNRADMLAGVLADIDTQIRELEVVIKDKERWEGREESRTDTLYVENTLEAAAGGKEVRKMFYLLGAERERKALEKLLHRRAEFTGQPLDGFEIGDTSSSASASASASASSQSVTVKKQKKIVGFGRESAVTYGLGEKYDEESDMTGENSRFEGKADDADLPEIVRMKGGRQWRVEKEAEMDTVKLAATAAKVKRNKLMYSGISF